MALGESKPPYIAFPSHKTVKSCENNVPPQNFNFSTEQMHFIDTMTEEDKPLNYLLSKKFDKSSQQLGSRNWPQFSFPFQPLEAMQGGQDTQNCNRHAPAYLGNHFQYNSEPLPRFMSPQSLSVNGLVTFQSRHDPIVVEGVDNVYNFHGTSRTELVVSPVPDKIEWEHSEENCPSHNMIFNGLAEYLHTGKVRSRAQEPFPIKGNPVKATLNPVRKRRHSDSDILKGDYPKSWLSRDVILCSKLMRLSSDSAAPRETAKFSPEYQPSRVPTKHQDKQDLRNGFENTYQLLDSCGVKETEVSCERTGVKMADDQRNSQPRYRSGVSLVKSVVKKTCCVVCEDLANGTFFGAVVCLPCKSFFIRCTKEGDPCFHQKCRGDCELRSKLRNRCQYCRYKRCLAMGMTRKEKPEYIEPATGQELCKVCGDLANGLHFGVNTCEGCKKFFRRGLKEHQSYICKENKDCWLNPRNRNNCRYCRYQKCIRVGMSRTAIKMGRPRRINPIITTNKMQTSANQVFHEHSQNVPCLVASMNLTKNQEQPSSYFNSSNMEEPQFAHHEAKQVMTSTQNQRPQLFEHTKSMSHFQWTDFEGPGQRDKFAIEYSRPQWMGDVSTEASHAMNVKNCLSYDHVSDTSETSTGYTYEQQSDNLFFLSPNARSMNRGQGHLVSEQTNFSQNAKKNSDQSPWLMSSAQLDKYPPLVTSHSSASHNNIQNEPTNFRTKGIFCDAPACGISCKNSKEHSCHPPSPKSVCVSDQKMFENKPCDVSTEKMSSQKHCHCEPEHVSFSSLHEKECNCIPLTHKIVHPSCNPERLEALDLRVTVTCTKSLDKSEWKKSQSEHKSIYETEPSAADHSLVVGLKNGTMSSYADAKHWDGKPKVQSMSIAYAVHGNSIAQPPYPLEEDIVTNFNSYRSSTNVILSGKCKFSKGCSTKSDSKDSEKTFKSGKDQHHYAEFQSVSLESVKAANGDNSSYRENGKGPLLVAKQPCEDRGQFEVDNCRQNVDVPSCRGQFSSGHQNLQDLFKTFTQKVNPDVIPHSSSPTESRYYCPPRLISPTKLMTGNDEFGVSKKAKTECISNDTWNGTDIVKSTPNKMTKSFDPYSDESRFRFVNKIFIAYDILSDLVSTAQKKPYSNQTGQVASSNAELKVFDDMLTNDFCYSPAKINQHWKQLYDQGPLEDVLTEPEYNLIIDIVRDYERKLFLCDEVANKPSINMTVSDSWPSRGNDKNHWMYLQERIVRQTFAETHFLHKIADKLQVKDKGKLEDHFKFLGNTILMASCEWFDPVRKKFHFFWNWKLPQAHPLNPFHQRITSLGSHIFNLHMHRAEITLLSILNLFVPGNEELKAAPQMTEKSKFILKILSHYLCSMNIDPKERIPELLKIMPKVNHMSVWYSNLIKNMKTDPCSMDQTLQDLTKLASNILSKSELSERSMNVL